jgi:hypothetical protein
MIFNGSFICHTLSEVYLKTGLGRHAFSESVHWILPSFTVVCIVHFRSEKNNYKIKTPIYSYRMVHLCTEDVVIKIRYRTKTFYNIHTLQSQKLLCMLTCIPYRFDLYLLRTQICHCQHKYVFIPKQ